MNRFPVLILALVGVCLVAGGFAASPGGPFLQEKVASGVLTQGVSIGSVLQQCEEVHGLHWVAMGPFSTKMGQPVEISSHEPTVGDVLQAIADSTSASLVVSNGVAWFGDERKAVSKENAGLADMLSALVDTYGVTLVARDRSDKRLSINGPYYFREIIEIVAAQFNLTPRYYRGAIFFSVKTVPGKIGPETGPHGRDMTVFPP